MGCEWNNGNCRGGFGTRPYLPHNCNRNGRPYDPPLPSPLGLTAGEREAVYEAVVNLVRARLEKARCV
jgi:hypothetical protein